MDFLTIGVAAALAAQPSETLLPQATVGFLAVTNRRYPGCPLEETQLGQLMDSPIMAAFRKDLRRQMREHWSNLRERFGLTLEDLQRRAGRRSGVAMIEPKPGEAAMALLADVTGHLKQARALLAKGHGQPAQTRRQQSALDDRRRRPLASSSCRRPAKSNFPRPAAGSRPFAARGRGPQAGPDRLCPGGKPAGGRRQRGGGARHPRPPGRPGARGSLAEVARLQGGDEALARRRPAATSGHQVRWFVFPLGYAEAARAATPEGKTPPRKDDRGSDSPPGFRRHPGRGRSGRFRRRRLSIDPSHGGLRPAALRELDENAQAAQRRDFMPQPWVPRDVATYTTLYVDILNAFDNFGPLFDELFGEGEKGVWKQVLEEHEDRPQRAANRPPQGTRQAPGAAGDDGRRLPMPITTSSERLLFAIETKDEKAVAAALEKCMKNDPTVKRRGDQRPSHLGDRRGRAAQGPLDLAGRNPLADAAERKDKEAKPPPGTEEKEKEEKRRETPFPAPSGGHGGQRAIAGRLAPRFPLEGPQADRQDGQLAASPEYKQVAGHGRENWGWPSTARASSRGPTRPSGPPMS